MTDEMKRDIEWLRSLKEGGHCGEGTLERRLRAQHNDRIDRLVAALSAPSSPGDGWEAQLQHWYADPFGGRPIWRDTPSIWNGQRQLGYREIYVKKPLPAAPSPGGDQ